MGFPINPTSQHFTSTTNGSLKMIKLLSATNKKRYQPSMKIFNHSSTTRCLRLNSIISRRSSSLSNSCDDDKKKLGLVPITSILNAAFLVSGTTIGGGFLALPTITYPIGFVSSSITLVGVWLFFIFQSFILVEAIQRTREDAIIQNNKNQGLKILSSQQLNPGVSTIAFNAFGKTGQLIVGILLTILIEATLVSQISRAGLMMFDGQNANYKLGCTLSSIFTAMIVFGPKGRGIQFATKMNSMFTIGFLLSIVGIFGFGIQSADWTRLGLLVGLRSNSSIDFNNISSAIPTFLQLLVYGEIVPCVCELLDYKTNAIRLAIIIGSFMTLCLQIGWSGLGISLISSTAASSMQFDVVNDLLQKGGLICLPLMSLAATAILTTILGSYLALMSMFNNIYFKIFKQKESEQTSISNAPLKQRFAVGSMITVPALLIASTSPTMFLRAIDFAGSYPVLLLWGILPPLIVLAQRLRWSTDSVLKKKKNSIDTSGPSYSLISLLLLSMSLVGLSARTDLTFFFNKIFGILL